MNTVFGQRCVLDAACALPKGMRQARVSSTRPTQLAFGKYAGAGPKQKTLYSAGLSGVAPVLRSFSEEGLAKTEGGFQ